MLWCVFLPPVVRAARDDLFFFLKKKKILLVRDLGCFLKQGRQEFAVPFNTCLLLRIGSLVDLHPL